MYKKEKHTTHDLDYIIEDEQTNIEKHQEEVNNNYSFLILKHSKKIKADSNISNKQLEPEPYVLE
tara:strand:- start:182 stop:376 length:195 start_codon:yes stop_codon:yes gene_type:complete